MTCNTFCPIPWNFQAVRSNGDMRVCCQANVTANKGVLRKTDGTPYNAAIDSMDDSRNSELMKIMRTNMLNGIWSTECQRCQTEESSGLRSRRQYETAYWADLTVDSVIPYTTADGTIDTTSLPVQYYDLRFGNLCNLSCRMCGPQDSTGWYDDWHAMTGQTYFDDTHGREEIYKQNGKLVSDSYSWHDSNLFWEQIANNTKNVQHVYMAGGEPLLIERHYEFLERCIDTGSAENMIIEYNTNMTSVPARVLNLWRKFKKVKIGASIDGFGKILEYQRYPAKWDKVLANIHKIDKEPNNIQPWFAFTVTAYNVLHLPDFMRWKLEDSGLEKFNSTKMQPIVTHHVAHRPLYLNVRVLPLDIKMLVRDKFDRLHAWLESENYPTNVIKQSDQIRSSICDYMFSADMHATHWKQFLAFTTKLDKIRDEDISTIIPELGPWL